MRQIVWNITLATTLALPHIAVAQGSVKPVNSKRNTSMEMTIHHLAANYAAAWSSQNAASVASHFAPTGSLKINKGAPSVGRTAITAAAQSFMTAFPDMVVSMDSLEVHGSHAVFHWTLKGANTGPSGTGKTVRFSGYEEWTINANGLIQRSLGHYDEAEYARQLKNGVPPGV